MSEVPSNPCVERVTHSHIKLCGHRTSTLYLANPLRLEVDRKELDGCLFPAGDICDWLVETVGVDPPVFRIFVELKGHNYAAAIAQLEKGLLKHPFDARRTTVRCYVVGTGFPSFRAQGQRQAARFRQRYGAQLEMVRDGSSVSLFPVDQSPDG